MLSHGHYSADTGPDGGSILIRFMPLPAPRPLIRRPTGALDVPLANGPREPAVVVRRVLDAVGV